MNNDSVDLAIRHISETKALVESLVISSESFDYPQAKVALKQLNKKLRELAKLQAELERRRKMPATNIHVLNFQTPSAPSPRV